jgi:acetyl-CoA carboxylase carboxyl transferase beta subunit/acetyl-CoA carboxylase carboxyl transferase alpha subunit
MTQSTDVLDATMEPSWVQCRSCDTLLYAKRLARNLMVCPECGEHKRLTARTRIAQLADPETFAPLALTSPPADVLGFVDSQPYPHRLARARHATGLEDAVLCGECRIEGHPIVLAVMDFRFMGGSLGSTVGEHITQAAERAIDRSLPLLLVTTSGGARMQEGAIALMQMVKTSAAVATMREAGLLTVSLITDPTYGGVAASYATNTDVLIAEPGARLGFAGPRVIRQTISQELPAGFQTAEFLLERGQVDAVVERRDLRSHLSRILSAAGPPPGALPHREGGILVQDPARLVERDPWDVVRLVRDPGRPTTRDYLDRVLDGFVELHGDRQEGDCAAVVAGLGRLDGLPVAVVGTQKGHTTRELVASNFGMPRPAGYRKALRVMQLAARLGLPVVTLVDTPGAFPGADAEAGGQMVAIAQNILQLTTLPTPVVAIITGEGGSGGALALAVADRVLVTENGTYSVISPEGCSAILWNTPAAAPEAARALRLTAPELLRLKVVDGVVPEPPGGAQRDIHTASENLRAALHQALDELLRTPSRSLLQARRARFRRYGGTATPGQRAPGGEGAAA